MHPQVLDKAFKAKEALTAIRELSAEFGVHTNTIAGVTQECLGSLQRSQEGNAVHRATKRFDVPPPDAINIRPSEIAITRSKYSSVINGL